MSPAAEQAFRHTLLEYAELMLFLLVAMTYINAMEDRRLFDALRAWLVRSGFHLRTLFWLTGGLAFCISPVADNLTTALLMCAVVLKVANGDRRFVNLACINIVIAANAGGAFSPFGDITTLMVWQAGKVQFGQFFTLLIPSLLNFLVPAILMSLMVPRHVPEADNEVVDLKRGPPYRRAVLADHHHGGAMPQFPPSATRTGHDAGARLSAVFRVLSAQVAATIPCPQACAL